MSSIASYESLVHAVSGAVVSERLGVRAAEPLRAAPGVCVCGRGCLASSVRGPRGRGASGLGCEGTEGSGGGGRLASAVRGTEGSGAGGGGRASLAAGAEEVAGRPKLLFDRGADGAAPEGAAAGGVRAGGPSRAGVRWLRRARGPQGRERGARGEVCRLRERAGGPAVSIELTMRT